MADVAPTRVSPDDISKIIEKASKEPGVNDVMALLRLSQEINQIEQIRYSWSIPPLVSQVSGTGRWGAG